MSRCIWANNPGFGTSGHPSVHWSHPAPNPHIYQARTCLFDQVTSSFWPPNHTSIHSPECLTITISNQKYFWFPQPASVQNFQSNILLDHPARVHSKFPTKHPSRSPSPGSSIISNQTPFHILQIGYICNFPSKPSSPDLSSHPVTRPRKIPSRYPSYTHFTTIHPKNPLPHPQPIDGNYPFFITTK